MKSVSTTSQPLFGSATQRVLVTQWLPLRDDMNKGSQVMNVYSLHQYKKKKTVIDVTALVKN